MTKIRADRLWGMIWTIPFHMGSHVIRVVYYSILARYIGIYPRYSVYSLLCVYSSRARLQGWTAYLGSITDPARGGAP